MTTRRGEGEMKISTLIKRLEILELEWPGEYWLYAASGVLCLMKYGEDGHPVMTSAGGFDPDYVVHDFSIPCDGGDW